jgi:hypothetical protein
MKLTFILLLIPMMLTAQKNPVELGDVQWLRSWDIAKEQSKAQEKPVLILFQEVPGCATCRNYGNDVLSHPMIVGAIEEYFVPLAIFNNKGGRDAEILKRYQEPSWNNPVVRLVDADGRNLQDRLAGNYTQAGLVQYLVQGLILTSGTAPQYLTLLLEELLATKHDLAEATYSMHCFWTGEAQFGKLSGVIKTTAGFQNGKEVVVVEYDPQRITRAELDAIAQTSHCAIENSGKFRPDSTPKYYLSNSVYRFIPMTELQKCRVNSALGEGQSPDPFLSPGQLKVLHGETRINCVGLSLEEAWERVSR